MPHGDALYRQRFPAAGRAASTRDSAAKPTVQVWAPSQDEWQRGREGWNAHSSLEAGETGDPSPHLADTGQGHAAPEPVG